MKSTLIVAYTPSMPTFPIPLIKPLNTVDTEVSLYCLPASELICNRVSEPLKCNYSNRISQESSGVKILFTFLPSKLFSVTFYDPEPHSTRCGQLFLFQSGAWIQSEAQRLWILEPSRRANIFPFAFPIAEILPGLLG